MTRKKYRQVRDTTGKKIAMTLCSFTLSSVNIDRPRVVSVTHTEPHTNMTYPQVLILQDYFPGAVSCFCYLSFKTDVCN